MGMSDIYTPDMTPTVSIFTSFQCMILGLDGACGVGSRADYPYLYFASPDTNVSLTVCVSSCPNSTESTVDCLTNSQVKNCSDSEVYGTTLCE